MWIVNGITKKAPEFMLQVSLVGYTNAGKSTIMNALTAQICSLKINSATLDSTTRLLEDDSRPKILLSDTVGFIRNLPHDWSHHSTPARNDP